MKAMQLAILGLTIFTACTYKAKVQKEIPELSQQLKQEKSFVFDKLHPFAQVEKTLVLGSARVLFMSSFPSYLEARDASGALLWQVLPEEKEAFISITRAENNSFYLLKIVDEAWDRGQPMLVKFSADGKAENAVKINHQGITPTYYFEEGVQSFPFKQYTAKQRFDMYLKDESIDLVSGVHFPGRKLSRIGFDGNVRVSKDYFVSNPAMGAAFVSTQDDLGNTYVAISTYRSEAAANTPPLQLGRDDERSVLVVLKIDNTGEVSGQCILNEFEEPSKLGELQWSDGKLYLVGGTRTEKNSRPGIKFENDSVIVQIDSGSMTIDHMNILDLGQDDIATTALVVNDVLYVGGKLGYIQVDTNSQVTSANAYLLRLDLKTGRKHTLEFGSDRDDKITALAYDEKTNMLVMSGTWDGLITHTCEESKSACYSKYFVKEFDLSTPL